MGVAAIMLAATAGAHPYTTWKEDGMSSDAHTHINSGEFVSSTTTTTTSTTVVPGTGYFTDEGISNGGVACTTPELRIFIS